MNNTTGQGEQGRIYHWHPNEHLHFHHEKFNKRNPVAHGHNEHHYQYRETKLEQVPKPRNNPTYRSTVFSTTAFVANKGQADMRHSPSERSSRQNINVAPLCETSYQQQFHIPKVPVHSSPRRRQPVLQTKIGHDY